RDGPRETPRPRGRRRRLPRRARPALQPHTAPGHPRRRTTPDRHPSPGAVGRKPAGPSRTPTTHGTEPPTTRDDPRETPRPRGPSAAAPPPGPGPRSSHTRHEAAHHGAGRPQTGTPALGLSGGTPPARPALQPRTAPGRPRHGTAPGRLPGPGAVGGGAPAGRYPRAATLSR